MSLMRATACVSIHAPHEGERRYHQAEYHARYKVSIHAPHEGERRLQTLQQALTCCFNPRSPRGGATIGTFAALAAAVVVSIHAPHEGERLAATFFTGGLTLDSIHAPHEGERHTRPPRRGVGENVSIHAPHEGERLTGDVEGTANFDGFNPRSPRGGATITPYQPAPPVDMFQSTLPTRGSDFQSMRALQL